MKCLRNKIARWFAENTSETALGDAILTALGAAIGGFAGFAGAIEWLQR